MTKFVPELKPRLMVFYFNFLEGWRVVFGPNQVWQRIKFDLEFLNSAGPTVRHSSFSSGSASWLQSAAFLPPPFASAAMLCHHRATSRQAAAPLLCRSLEPVGHEASLHLKASFFRCAMSIASCHCRASSSTAPQGPTSRHRFLAAEPSFHAPRSPKPRARKPLLLRARAVLTVLREEAAQELVLAVHCWSCCPVELQAPSSLLPPLRSAQQLPFRPSQRRAIFSEDPILYLSIHGF
jgi:hypothetical protein